MASKVVPQGIQNDIKKDIADILINAYDFYERFGYGVTEGGNLIVQDMTKDGELAAEYEIITVIIPKQAAHHSEVRNG